MRNRDDRKEKIIREKALEMIVQEGFDGFSMQKLAKAAGVSPATLYVYFKDREDLILQICAEEAKGMAKATLKNFSPSMSFAEGLRVQWLNRARYCLRYPDKMSFLEQMRHSALRDRYVGLVGDDFISAMKTFVDNAIRNRELVKVPLEVFWSVAYAPLYNLVKFHKEGVSVGGKPFRFSEKMMSDTLSLVIKALTP